MREIGDRQGEANSLNNLGIIADTRGDLAEAERLHRESLPIRERLATDKAEANSLTTSESSQKDEATLLRRNGCIERVCLS
jgi:Flp pilus assembly protein TadD